jgi:arsenate reductase
MITIYGIRNCDKCRSAVKWFEREGAKYTFHDVRTDGLTLALLQRWQKSLGDDALVNRRSPTWRAIADDEKIGLQGDSLLSLILAHPTLIKRPLVECDDQVLVGYDEAAWKNLVTNGKLIT